MKIIKPQEYVDKLNECMQKHEDYSGEYAKLNYMEKGIELFNTNGNKILGGVSKAFLECDGGMRLIYNVDTTVD